jgi:hypothetical protein
LVSAPAASSPSGSARRRSSKITDFRDFLGAAPALVSGVMAVYLVETYLSRRGARDLGSLEERVRRAAESLTRDGIDVRLIRSVFVPADETCFHLFDAASVAAVCATGERAAMAFDRVSEAT